MPDKIAYSPIKRALGERLCDEAGAATTLGDEHKLIEAMLEQIEALADGLPLLPPRSTMEQIIANLRHGLPAHCAHEEQALAAYPAEAAARALRILQDEHIDNDAVGMELAEALEDELHQRKARHPEALGQLARQYFMLMRRHMTWEDYVFDGLDAAPEAPVSIAPRGPRALPDPER